MFDTPILNYIENIFHTFHTIDSIICKEHFPLKQLFFAGVRLRVYGRGTLIPDNGASYQVLQYRGRCLYFHTFASLQLAR